MDKILIKDKTIKVNKTMKSYSSEEYFIHGLIILDKPSGPRCREVTNELKRALEVSHAGHAGTLDPKVTGILPIGIEKATKILGLLSQYPKTYEGKMRIHGNITRKKLDSAAKKFTGKIEQLPPKISAVKRTLRVREVYEFKILDVKDRTVSYRVHCEAGTYIRKLCHDLGEYLGVGAHMTKLRRVQSGPFTLKEAVSLDKVIKGYKSFLKDNQIKHLKSIVKPVEVIAKDMPKVWIDDGAIKTILQGAPVFAPGLLRLSEGIKKDDFLAILTRENRMIALGKAKMSSKQMLASKKGACVKTDSVLIPIRQ